MRPGTDFENSSKHIGRRRCVLRQQGVEAGYDKLQGLFESRQGRSDVCSGNTTVLSDTNFDPLKSRLTTKAASQGRGRQV
ncbi:hypothetical protein JN531_001180 [Flagellatimonas centrodinii]|uniref:hypothetical protein n=1 Tax=Flagellatimonas centrodinii TaxID=2806210 RepID=UPI001FED55FC|nr:hypothetical protein [Flagellatimonas centrodinii]ULQ46910.1 hypothetical protein JN531_001180 [Flagellatimonas centrodinii]